MNTIHVVMALLATWRLTEVITTDRIFERARKRWPIYLWTCPRCVSVWAGAMCTLLWFYLPLLNWPLAFSWTLIVHNQIGNMIRSRAGRRIVITVAPDNAININTDNMEISEVPKVLAHIIKAQTPLKEAVKRA